MTDLVTLDHPTLGAHVDVLAKDVSRWIAAGWKAPSSHAASATTKASAKKAPARKRS